MPRQGSSPSGTLFVLVVMTAPALAVLTGLVMLDRLAAGAAVMAGALLALIFAVLAQWHGHAVAVTLDWIGRLTEGEQGRLRGLPGGPISAQMEAALGRLQRVLDAERRSRSAESVIAATVLDRMPDPVLILDRAGRIDGANDAAKRLLGTEIEGRDLAVAMRQPAVLDSVQLVLRGEQESAEVEVHETAPPERWLQARIFSLGPDRDEGPAAVLALYDLTAIKKADEMRADFVANVGHELRTPLATLVGFIETLRGPARGDPEARERFLGIMAQQADRMARLVDDLLSLSAIEMHEHAAPEDRIALAPVVEGVVNMLEITAAEKEITLQLDLPELPPVLADADELTQVFQNLIENAIKYGRQGSAVTISGRSNGDGVAVTVADQGAGIAREHIPRLTERFYRVDTARSRDLGGTGLGLAIVKHIVNRHRGALTIESEVGVGSRFTVSLPAAPAVT